MTTVNFVHPDGRTQSVEADDGQSAMMVATINGIDEIVAECGGNAMCATCHVYVDQKWVGELGAVSDEEDALLDGVAAERSASSRLSCQIKIAPGLDGLVLRLPDKQI